MRKLLALAVLVSTPLYAQDSTKILETTKFQDGLIQIKIEATSSAKTGGILAQTRAKIKASKQAKEIGEKELNQICSNGHLESTLSHSDANCNVLDSNEDKMQCVVKTDAICKKFPGVKSAQGLNLKKGLIAASSACLELIDDRFQIDETVVENCNKIQNVTQFECVELITNYNTIKVYSIGECAKFKNEHSLEALRMYSGDTSDDGSYFGTPSVEIISTLAKLETKEQEACVKNLMKLDRISARNISKECLKNSNSIGDRIWNFFN
ncbi:MAG: hypothetical protein EP319_14720 [Deltaproteobacteria bacterium]|nr:MAG: hypothetical protein EP319_14720 [Deltaproteobacteria bacterium]